MKCSDFDRKIYLEKSIYHDQIEICLHLALLYIDKTGDIPILRSINTTDEEIIGWLKVEMQEKCMKQFMSEECEKVSVVTEQHDIPRNVIPPTTPGTYFLMKRGSMLLFEPYKK